MCVQLDTYRHSYKLNKNNLKLLRKVMGYGNGNELWAWVYFEQRGSLFL